MISLNGKLRQAEEPSLGSSNRSFRYGDGLFETIRVNNGHVLWSERHFYRLKKGAELLRLELPETFSHDFFVAQIHRVYRHNHPEGGHARVRFAIYRTEGGFYVPEENAASFLIETTKLSSSLYPLNRKGILVDFFEEYYKPCHALSNIKSSSALIYVMAGLYRKERKLDDCLLINDERLLAEAISSNVFLVNGNQLITPSLDQACVEGVMRSVVIELAPSLGFKIEERPVEPDELLHADEVFLTNTISGIIWVLGFRKKRYFNKAAKALSDALNKRIGK